MAYLPQPALTPGELGAARLRVARWATRAQFLLFGFLSGAWGVHVPQPVTWAWENADPPLGHARFRALARIHDLVDLLSELDAILP